MWDAPAMVAAIALGEGSLPPMGTPASFNPTTFLVAALVHFPLSIIYALILAAIVRGWGTGASVGAGAVFGLGLYLVNFYGFTALFPWFAMARK